LAALSRQALGELRREVPSAWAPALGVGGTKGAFRREGALHGGNGSGKPSVPEKGSSLEEVGVLLDEVGPLLGDLVLGEDGFHRGRGLAGAAVGALHSV